MKKELNKTVTKTNNIALENQFNKELKSIYEINQTNRIDFIKALNNHINQYIKLFNYDVIKKLVTKLSNRSSELEILTNFIIFNKENKLQLNESRIASFSITNIKLMLNKLDITKISDFKKELAKIKFDVLIVDKYNLSLQNLINKYLVIKIQEDKKTIVKKAVSTNDKKENEAIKEDIKKELEKTITLQFNANGTPKNLKETLKSEFEFLISKGVKKEDLKNIMLEILA